MTRNELHIAFKIEMDKSSQSVAYGGCPSFLPEEIDYWLNKAYYDVLITKFTGNNATRLPFEGSVKRISDLERLVKTDKDITATLEENTNKVVVTDLLNRSEDNKGRLFFVSAILHWVKNSTDNKATIQLTTHENAQNFVETYNNKPWISKPTAIIENNSLMIYIDPEKMDGTYSVDITYVKHPTLISDLPDNQGLTEIPEQMQNDLVNRAVQLALEDIESKRIETKSQLNQMID